VNGEGRRAAGGQVVLPPIGLPPAKLPPARLPPVTLPQLPLPGASSPDGRSAPGAPGGATPRPAPAAPAGPSVLDACEPVFSALFELQSARPAPDVDTLYGSLAGQLAAVRGRAGAAGLSDQEADAVTFALAAFADEMVMRSDWEGRGQWPLLEYAAFGTHYAGEQFFRVLGQGQDTSNGHHPLAWEGTWQGPGGAAVLEVYALCLLFGFRGRHSVTAPDAYQRELARVLAYIRARPAPPLSPRPLSRPFGGSAEGPDLSPLTRQWALAGTVLLLVWLAVIVLVARVAGA